MSELEDMLEMDRRRLDAEFSAGAAPDVEDIQGYLRGVHLAGAGVLDGWVWKRSSNVAPWRGMTVDGDEGVNELGYPPLTFQAVEFDVSTTSLEDGDAVLFDYGDRNHPPLCGIREHVRRVDDDVYLAAARYSVRDDLRFMYYFGLEPAESIEVD